MSQRRYAFIVRLWQKSEALRMGVSSQGTALRGSLQRVDSEKVHYFSSLNEIPTLLRQLMEAPRPERQTDTQSDRKVKR